MCLYRAIFLLYGDKLDCMFSKLARFILRDLRKLIIFLLISTINNILGNLCEKEEDMI